MFPGTVSVVHTRVQPTIPFSEWPAMGSRLRILSPFQVCRRQVSGHGYCNTPWTLPRTSDDLHLWRCRTNFELIFEYEFTFLHIGRPPVLRLPPSRRAFAVRAPPARAQAFPGPAPLAWPSACVAAVHPRLKPI